MTGLHQNRMLQIACHWMPGMAELATSNLWASRLREEYFEGWLQPLFMCGEYWSSRLESLCALGRCPDVTNAIRIGSSLKPYRRCPHELGY